MGNLLANTDLVATVPVLVAQTLVRIAQVKLLAPPIAFHSFMIKQHWHERYQHARRTSGDLVVHSIGNQSRSMGRSECSRSLHLCSILML